MWRDKRRGRDLLRQEEQQQQKSTFKLCCCWSCSPKGKMVILWMKIIAYKKYSATEHSWVILLTSLSSAFCANLQMSWSYECFSTLCLLQLNVWYCENTDSSFFPWVMCYMTIKSHLCCVTCKSFEKLLPNSVIYYKTLCTKIEISLKIRSCHFFQR